MDMVPRRTGIDYRDAVEEAPASISALVERLTGMVRRQYRLLLGGTAAAIVIAVLYLLVTPAQYTATATLSIDSSTLRALPNQMQQAAGDIRLDLLRIDSQVEILNSRKIALAVVDSLNLVDNPEFVGTGGSRLWCLYLCTRDAGSKEEREQKALAAVMSQHSIGRNEKTYILDISYTARNPVTAARVANTIAEAYIDDQLEAKYQIITRAGTWLQNRIDELKAKATTADRAVLEFKEKNNIVDFGNANSTAGAGRLIGEQQLYDLNSQLAAARASTSEAKARLDRIEQVRKMDVGEAAGADILKNEVITRLRNQYLDLAAREANLSSRYGPDHGAAVNLRDQMQELKRNIVAELGRIAVSYQNDYEIAKTRVENLERTLNGLVSEGQTTNRDKLGLSELESTAKIYHSLYENFLQHYMEAIQQQSFPITDARIISEAVPPSHKSKPKLPFVLITATMIGLVISLGIATFREVLDSAFRTGPQLEQALQVSCLSVIPLATASVISSRPVPRSILGGSHLGAARSHVSRQQAENDPSEALRYAFADPLMRRAVEDPASIFTEAFRAIKVAAWLETAIRDNKVIGVTSTLPNEGKSTVASNLAALMADAGKRVVLIDADMRNPTLARSLTPRPTSGWMDVLTGKSDLEQVTGVDPTTGLALVPLLLDEKPIHADEVLSSQFFKGLIEQLRQRYDYVIIDLPPIAPVVDVRAAAPVVDSFVFVVEWGGTPIQAVQRHLAGVPELRSRILGAVLNKADLKALKNFESPSVYHSRYYAQSNGQWT